jgi:hypothetical protein
MYQLTHSEATTILSILSRDPAAKGPEEELLGLPPSTFYATRRRIYEAGWLTDRFVPHPWVLGASAVECFVIRPRPSERASLEANWSASPGTVVLWSGLNVIFAVVFRRRDEVAPFDEGTSISITPTSGSLPVYFDYSGAWSRFIRVEPRTGYPRALDGPVGSPERTTLPALKELLLASGEDGATRATPHRWHSPSKLARPHLRLLNRGSAQSRTLLNLDALPPYGNRWLGEIVLLTGELRSGASSATLLGALSTDCRVSPILLATDGHRVLVMALGQLDANANNRTTVSRAEGNVAATLDSMATNIEMTIERSDSVRKLVDHRYDRLIAASPAPEP